MNRAVIMAAALLAADLAGCASAPKPALASRGARAPASPASDADLSVCIERAEALLEQGEPAAARAEVVFVLARRPGDPAARLLLDQIDMAPRVLLGRHSFHHVAQPGETFDSLAQRYLGDRRLFFALARYNGFTRGDQPIAGRALAIPGSTPRTALVGPRSSRPAPLRAVPVARADPAAAQRLRADALVDLDAGRAGQAVALLSRAVSLDPGNVTIRDDLGRAQRIEGAIHGR